MPAPLHLRTVLLFLLCVLAALPAAAQGTTRVVILKQDGLPNDVVDRAVRARDPRTGKSMLPWIEHVFYERGTRLSNFYVRGMSLSGPSWSLLDTGHHLQIKGNVEYDRYTHHPYDYLNFLPFWIGNAQSRVSDMWGTQVLDDLGIPLLLDAYGFDERYQSFQLFQRGSRWLTLGDSLRNRITSRSTRRLIDEWYVGIDTRAIMTEQLERELLEKLNDPQVRYLDHYTTDFDHVAHHNRDHASHLIALRELDALVGRVWTAISRTPQASETLLILVSDHGVNADERVYSQGFNIVTLLAGRAGGGHHVATKRRLMTDYSIKGIYPLVPLITTTSKESRYLRGEDKRFPTALVDFDGNERASLHLRHSPLNVLHILFQQLRDREVRDDLRMAAADGFLRVLEEQRPAWQRVAREMREELAALRTGLEQLRASIPPAPPRRKGTRRVDPEPPEQKQARVRAMARADSWAREEREYSAYVATLERLLAVDRAALLDPRTDVEDLIPPQSMGERNTLFDLQHYVAGPAAGGLVLQPDGRLDFERSFDRIDYFDLLHAQRVQNNVQGGLSDKPVDFTAVALPCAALDAAVREDADTCAWLDGGAGHEALLLGRRDASDRLLVKYVPVSNLTQARDGAIRFDRAAWRVGLPLRLLEDPHLQVPTDPRVTWLDEWHTDVEWLRATHRTRYSNAIVGLHEHFAHHDAASLDPEAPGLAAHERLIRRLRLRQRGLAEADMLLLAADHWNFDVRGFNPGGNHGSFFRPSTNATLMFAGGDRTGVPRGLDVQEPYDSLSFMPTVLRLTGQVDLEGRLSPGLLEKGFRPFPGRAISEVVPPRYFRITATLPDQDVIDTIAPPSSP